MSIVGNIGLALLVVLCATGAVEFMIFRAGALLIAPITESRPLSSWAPAAPACGRYGLSWRVALMCGAILGGNDAR
jgi:hypothetical protein